MKHKAPRSLYNDIYKKYDKNRAKASNDVTELPKVLELVGTLKDKHILDMGCGLGKHAKEFIKRGGIVTGYDASEKMVEITKDVCGRKGNFFRATHETVVFEPDSFDVINASYTIAYSNKLEHIFEHVYKWLKPKGVFIFSIPHPLWLLKRVKDMDYSKPHKISITIASYDVELFNYYYPLDFYIQLINKSGFSLVNLAETTISRKYKGWSEEKYRIPNALVFKLEKN